MMLSSQELERTSNIILDTLCIAADEKRLISVGGLRRVGKSHALARFAMMKNATVIVPTEADRINFIINFDYSKVVTSYDVHRLRGTDSYFVLEEGILHSVRNDIMTYLGDRVLTGYVS
jgi:hypothetical protein